MPKVTACGSNEPHTPALYTYYAIMSLVVVILAITLIWLPFVQLISEISTIISKVIIYFNVNFLGYEDDCLVSSLETLLLCEKLITITSFLCLGYVMFLASGDFLIFAACYVCSLPDVKYLHKLKLLFLRMIICLLNLTGNKLVYIDTRNDTRKSCLDSSPENCIN